jgi:uncharacterized protein YyaL (SSP411 family)
MTENLLRHSASPYLLQHKDNPVHWHPWGPDAFAEATRDQKPILLSVGYAACHWCHVMAHESFEDPATAEVMNRLFVNIKVDREERPDVDQIYMAALHELGEQGGWPLTMFLTPDGAPIWGGTYFPPTARYGRPAFTDVLREIARIFHEEPAKVDHNRGLLLQRLSRPADAGSVPLDRSLLDQAAERLLGLMDRTRGGVRGAPKFPQASLLKLLWRAGTRSGQPDRHDAVLLTLRNIANGGIYDHVGGGFARYSVDDRWLVPHFEKMLYDNAQLIELLAHAYAETRDPVFRVRIDETVTWLQREMVVEDGAFAASLDADSDGHEGRFYVWTLDEILDVLGPEEGAFFAATYDVTAEGNWEGTSILNRLATAPFLDHDSETRLATSRGKLLVRRNRRNPPGRDDKVLTDWNGLMIAALATAGALVGRPDWLDIAIRTYRRVMETASIGGRLAHSSRAGKHVFPGLATDYAAMVKAALALHAATLDRGYVDDAERLADALRTHHWDSETPGYFLSADDAEGLILRPRSNVDEATPSANALMGANLVRLWRLTGNDDYRRDVDAMLSASSGAIAANLFSAAGTLNALDLRLGAIDVVVLHPPATDATTMLAEIRRHWSPNLVLSAHTDTASLPTNHPAAAKPAVDRKVTVYVCRGETCSLPVTDPERLVQLLAVPAI